MAYIDCDKCSHGKVCAYRHQYDDHIVTCSHWQPADDKTEIERLRAKVEKRTNEKLELGRIYTQKLKATKAEAIISFAKRLCDGRVSNDPVVIAAKALLKELTEDKL